MKLDYQYENCERIILKEYQDLKQDSNNGVVISHHLGEFSQDTLVYLVSLINNALLKNTSDVNLKQTLKYIVIEMIQNIISHSDKINNEPLLAYFVLTENKEGYTFYTSNTVFNKKSSKFITLIKDLLKVDKNKLNAILEQKLQLAELDEQGRAGIGILSVLYKTDKNFKYNLTRIGEELSLLNLSATLLKNKVL